MKKTVSIILSIILILSLTACGSKKDEYKKQSVTYEGKFKVEVVADKIQYNPLTYMDNLLVDVVVTNIGDKEAAFSSVADIHVKQGNGSLNPTQIQNKEGQFIYTIGDDKLIKPGETQKFTTGWVLADKENDVVVSFDGLKKIKSAGAMTFKVKGRESKEHIAYEKEQESIEEAKKTMKEVKITKATVKVPKGWYINSFNDDSVEFRPNENGGVTYVNVNYSTAWGDAKHWAKEVKKNYDDDNKKIDSIKINGRNYVRLTIGDNRYMLFTNCKKVGAIRIFGMVTNMKELKKIAKGITYEK